MNGDGVLDRVLDIAGRERGADVLAEIRDTAAGIRDPGLERLLADEQPILDVRDAENEEEGFSRQLKAFGARNQIDMEKCRLPEATGRAAKLLAPIRALVWRLLRFAFDWLAYKQNIINEQQAILLAREARLRRAENAKLRERVEALERKLNTRREDV